jgi:hypothetical protein
MVCVTRTYFRKSPPPVIHCPDEGFFTPSSNYSGSNFNPDQFRPHCGCEEAINLFLMEAWDENAHGVWNYCNPTEVRDS